MFAAKETVEFDVCCQLCAPCVSSIAMDGLENDPANTSIQFMKLVV